MITLSVKRLTETATFPSKKFPEDAGWDLYSDEDVILEGYGQKVISTGIQITNIISDDDTQIVLQVWPKSGKDSKYGLHTGAGIIDQNYRGEILVLIKNTFCIPYEIKRGDAIAQMIPVILPNMVLTEDHTLTATSRGSSGGIVTTLKENR